MRTESLMNHSGHFEPKTGLNDSLKETEQFANKSNISVTLNHILHNPNTTSQVF